MRRPELTPARGRSPHADQADTTHQGPIGGSRLSGASQSQLRYWRQSHKGEAPLLVPEHGTRPHALYSYRDVLVLRMFARLRGEVSLQTIRRAVTWMEEHLADGQDLSERTLLAVPEKKSIVYFSEDGEFLDVGKAPGQYGHQAVMRDLFRPFTNRRGDLVPDLTHPASGLLVDPDIRGGVPVVEGTRITYNLLAGLARDGLALAEIREFYPGVSAEAVKGATELAGRVAYAHAA